LTDDRELETMSEHTGHIVPSKLNWLIWAILMVATFVTYKVAQIDLGPFNTVVALVIATCKASIVVLIFMQVKYTSEKMTKAVLLFAIAWLILLLSLSLIDYSSRFAG
jgi:cytochrome c oxidase subunit 4